MIARYLWVLAIGACFLPGPLVAQTQSVAVPADQRALTGLLMRHYDMIAGAPNDIQRRKIEAEYHQEFCSKMPVGQISGWVGAVGHIRDAGPNHSIEIDLRVDTVPLNLSEFGKELSVSNYYSYGISRDNTQPHEATEIPADSPLYDAAANLREGDTVRFDATIIPYISDQACRDNDTARFALVRFTRLQKLGWNLRRE